MWQSSSMHNLWLRESDGTSSGDSFLSSLSNGEQQVLHGLVYSHAQLFLEDAEMSV